MKKLLAAFSLMILISATNSQAIMIEPYLGYGLTGAYEAEASGVTASIDLQSHIGYGLRLAYSTMGFFIGGDYFMTKGELDNAAKTDFDTTTLALVGGYNFPMLLRAYAGIKFDTELDFEGSSTNLSGDGYFIGGGYTGLPFIAINLEYHVNNYDAVGGVDYSTSFTMLNVSLPLSL